MSTTKATPFQLTGADGEALRGEVRTAGCGVGRPVVVICHGFKGFKDWGFFPKLAERLARAGLTAVSFNFSSSGVGPDGMSFTERKRFGHGTYSGDLQDLATVADALVAGNLVPDLPGTSTYGLFGHSRGGGIVILHAGRDPAVRALVTWAAIARSFRWDVETVVRWRSDGELDIVNARTGEVLPLYTDLLEDVDQRAEALDTLKAATCVSADWLIIHGSDDESVPVAEARELFRAASHETTRLQIVENGTHAFGAQHPWKGYSGELREAMDATVGWFAGHLT
ncbi:MAG: alpha/beta fold hydrolase [Gemmatimonadota bacterium]|nr:MAG: alpha/beta fold hydrolase [Gemmatimonadota bacterium]